MERIYKLRISPDSLLDVTENQMQDHCPDHSFPRTRGSYFACLLTAAEIASTPFVQRALEQLSDETMLSF